MQRFDILDPQLNIFQNYFLEASAGTGKTFAIEHLVVRLLLESEEPLQLKEILAVTFTKEAAHEMKTRIRKKLEGIENNSRVKEALANFDEIQVFTIHGFCHRMLTEFAFEAGTPLKMSSPDRPDHIQEMNQVVSDFLRTGNTEYAEEVSDLLKRSRFDFDRLKSLIVAEMQKEAPHLSVAKECRDRWLVKAERSDHFTFDDLLRKMESALDIPLFLEKVRGKYKAAIVDEFQDTDPVQWRIFERLFLESHLIYLVGDPKQSIYGFRSADIYTYMRAADAIGQDKKAYLDTNFRSSPPLIEKLNALFTEQPEWISLPSLPGALHYHPVNAGRNETKLDEEPIVYFGAKGKQGREKSWPTKLMEEDKLLPFIASEIIRLHTEHGIQFSEMVILIKDRFQAQRVQLHLNLWKIPTLIKQTFNLVDSRGFAALEILLNATARPENENLVRSALYGPLMESDTYWRDWKAGEFANARGDRFASDPAQFTIEKLEAGRVGCKDAPLAKAKLQLSSGTSINPFFALKQIFEEKGFAHFFAEFMSKYFRAHDDPTLYSTLRQTAEILMAEDSIEGCLHLLQELRKGSPETDQRLKLRGEEGEDRVPIMTTFASKGLEFDVVFALGMASRHQSEEFNADKEAEKMRQLYVAFTRSREKLYIPILYDEAQKPIAPGSGSPIELFFGNRETPVNWVGNIPLEPYSVEKKSIELIPPPKVQLHFTPEYLTSFTAMSKTQSHSLLTEQYHNQDLSQKTPHTLPIGAETGVVIHTIFETHFQDRTIPLAQVVFETVNGTHLEGWEEVIETMVEDTLSMPLAPNFSLDMLQEGEYFQEMEFLFHNGNQLVKGFVDLVFIKDDHFYIVDWKTNWLGPSESDYTEEKLHTVMAEHDYYLQAKLYKEALQRYVKRFYFGGAYYLFVRGKKGATIGNC